MSPSPREALALLVFVAGLAILAWALFTNPFAPGYTYDADPVHAEPPPYATVHDFPNLSEPAQRGVGRSIEAGESVTLQGAANRAPSSTTETGVVITTSATRDSATTSVRPRRVPFSSPGSCRSSSL